MLGFETIGNATVTYFDDKPVLTTDPWLIGNPYFGSWCKTNKIIKRTSRLYKRWNRRSFQTRCLSLLEIA